MNDASNIYSYLINTLFCSSSRLKFSGMSSESITPLMKDNQFGKTLSALLLIKTLRL